jgi:hypothetical protein
VRLPLRFPVPARPAILLLAGLLSFPAAVRVAAAGKTRSPAPPADEFFIVSSVNVDKGTMVVKRPTETTLTILVTPKTRLVGEKGEAIRFTDLRAGDTVFIASEPDPSGHPGASSIRRGPMTLEELRRRYLRF